MEREKAFDWLRLIAYQLCDAPISDFERWNSVEILLPEVLSDLESQGIELGVTVTPQLEKIIKEVFSRQAALKTISWCSS